MQPSNCWLIKDHYRPGVGSFLFQPVVNLQAFPDDNQALPPVLNVFGARRLVVSNLTHNFDCLRKFLHEEIVIRAQTQE